MCPRSPSPRSTPKATLSELRVRPSAGVTAVTAVIPRGSDLHGARRLGAAARGYPVTRLRLSWWGPRKATPRHRLMDSRLMDREKPAVFLRCGCSYLSSTRRRARGRARAQSGPCSRSPRSSPLGAWGSAGSSCLACIARSYRASLGGLVVCRPARNWVQLTLPLGQCRILMPRVPSPVVLHLAVVVETSRPSPSSLAASSS